MIERQTTLYKTAAGIACISIIVGGVLLLQKQRALERQFIDSLVAPYSLRAHEGAPVATSLLWLELTETEPQKYTLKNIFRRLSRIKDPWSEFLNSASRLKI